MIDNPYCQPGEDQRGPGPRAEGRGKTSRRAFLTDLPGVDTPGALKIANGSHKLAASGLDMFLFFYFLFFGGCFKFF